MLDEDVYMVQFIYNILIIFVIFLKLFTVSSSHLEHGTRNLKAFLYQLVSLILFIFNSHGIIVYFLVYVDGFVFTGNNTMFIDKFVQQLHDRFALKDFSALHQFLGVEVINTVDGIFFVST